MPSKCLDRIRGAAWIEPACIGRQKGGDNQPINLDQKYRSFIEQHGERELLVERYQLILKFPGRFVPAMEVDSPILDPRFQSKPFPQMPKLKTLLR